MPHRAPINLIPINSFKLLKRLNHRGNLHAVPASLKGKYVIRFTVTSARTTGDDIIKDWAEIRAVASEIPVSYTHLTLPTIYSV